MYKKIIYLKSWKGKHTSLLISLIFAIFNLSAQNTQQPELVTKAEIEKAYEPLKVSFDEVTEIYTYTDKLSADTKNEDGLILYITQAKTKKLELRLRVQCTSDHLFKMIGKCMIKTDYGVKEIYGMKTIRYFSPEGSYGWFELKASSDIIKLIRDIISSKTECTVRCFDDLEEKLDRKIDNYEIGGFENILIAWEVLNRLYTNEQKE